MKHKILRLLIVLLVGGYFFAKANPTDPTVIKVISFLNIGRIMTGPTDVRETNDNEFLLEEKTGVIACTMEYAPVCAETEVICLTPPCATTKKTFSNKCLQEADKKSRFLYEGACK